VNGTTTTYTLDLAAGLTQVLADGAHTYLYGNGRIAQYAGATPEYFLADALGSVRQLTDAAGNVTLAKGYQPYGEVLESAGDVTTAYGYTGEWTDSYIKLIYLRSRWYSPQNGRFTTRDTWQGDYTRPMSYNAWLYSYANPINLTDPKGYYGEEVHFGLTKSIAREEILLRCPSCLSTLFGWQLADLLARADYHVDYGTLNPIYGAPELHFTTHSDAWSDLTRATNDANPYFVGSALHEIQDYWSHKYEGYSLPLGHAIDSLFCFTWPKNNGHCQRPPNDELGILLTMWNEGIINNPTREALTSILNYLGPDVNNLSTSNLFDIWLRVQDGQPETRRAAMWKDLYGYSTDDFYSFTHRDRQAVDDTRDAILQYLDSLSAIDLCVFSSSNYSMPSDEEIKQFLLGSE
jgi:RHS repeat-associated protein